MGMLEKRNYQENIPDFRMKRQASFWLYALRGRWGLSRTAVSATRLPETMSRFVNLFQVYDDVADSLERLPTPREVKTHESVSPLISSFIQTVCDSPIRREYKLAVFSLVNAERYRQYDLQARFGYSAQTLPFPEVLAWRENAAGYLTATSAQMAALFLERDHGEILQVGRLAYLYGANLQLFDDIIDVQSDLTHACESTMTAALRQTGELDAMQSLCEDASSLTYADVRATAPMALTMLQDARAEYVSQIAPEDRLRLVHVFSQPSSLPVMFSLYQSISQR